MRLGALPNIWLVRTLHCSSLMRAGLGAKPDEYMRAKVAMSIRPTAACRQSSAFPRMRRIAHSPLRMSTAQTPRDRRRPNRHEICGYCGKRRNYACGTCGQPPSGHCWPETALLSSATLSQRGQSGPFALKCAFRLPIYTVRRHRRSCVDLGHQSSAHRANQVRSALSGLSTGRESAQAVSTDE